MLETGRFLFNLGSTEELEAPGRGEEGIMAGRSPDEKTPGAAPRGLALKSFTLNRSFEHPLIRWFDKRSEIVLCATAFDLSGKDPFIYPAKLEDVTDYVRLEEGATYTWTLGDGFPVFPPREIMGGLVVGIQAAESDQNITKIAKALIAAGDAVKTDGGIKKLLEDLASNPGKVAGQAVVGALGELAKLVGNVLKASEAKLDPVGLAAGQFSATESWEGKLTQEMEGCTIHLVETK
jgi:hypothetical protein